MAVASPSCRRRAQCRSSRWRPRPLMRSSHTAGATVNVTLKSGTNRIKGETYYHYRDEALSGNDFFLERAGRPKDTLDYKRYGFSAGGPAWLGRMYDGRNRTFFFSAFEWLYDQFPE